MGVGSAIFKDKNPQVWKALRKAFGPRQWTVTILSPASTSENGLESYLHHWEGGRKLRAFNWSSQGVYESSGLQDMSGVSKMMCVVSIAYRSALISWFLPLKYPGVSAGATGKYRVLSMMTKGKSSLKEGRPSKPHWPWSNCCSPCEDGEAFWERTAPVNGSWIVKFDSASVLVQEIQSSV